MYRILMCRKLDVIAAILETQVSQWIVGGPIIPWLNGKAAWCGGRLLNCVQDPRLVSLTNHLLQKLAAFL